MKNTSWSKPNTNIFSAILNLRSCLQGGYKARLIRIKNEDCEYPIMEEIKETDFRAYKFSYGTFMSYDEIMGSTCSDFSKYLTLNYKSVFGTKEAMEEYYKNGTLSEYNFLGYGTPHLVKRSDIVDFLNSVGDTERAMLFENKLSEKNPNQKYMVDLFQLKSGKESKPKSFNRKLWAVEMGYEEDYKLSFIYWLPIWILNKVLYPMKYIPTKTVLRMKEYTNYTFRVGGITNGFSVEFQIPKKFSFR